MRLNTRNIARRRLIRSVCGDFEDWEWKPNNYVENLGAGRGEEMLDD